jgi:hypothetical protein
MKFKKFLNRYFIMSININNVKKIITKKEVAYVEYCMRSLILSTTILNMMPWIKRFDSKNILIDVVASALEDLGFVVKTEHVVLEKEIISGRLQKQQFTADVLGVKIVDDLKFTVYASCYNRNIPVGVNEVKYEYGVIRDMRFIPNVRILVANSFLEDAKKKAIEDGFVVIELGEMITESNVDKAYLKVYKKLNKLFTEVSPKWMQDFIENIKKLTDEIKKNLGET